MTYDLSVARARDPLIAITVFAAIAIITTTIRLTVRRKKDISLGHDDYLLLSALLLLFVSIGVLAGGVGRHIEDAAALDVAKTLQLILPFEALYGITLCLIKLSIIAFYFRIFGSTRSFKISAYVASVVLIMWAISVVLETFLLCRPLAYNWDTTIKGTCGQRNDVYVSAGALNVITDFMVMALPIPHILKLQLAWRRKLGLVLMFSLGLLITVISIVRIKSLQVISFTDPTYTLPMGLFWTTLEPCLCIINANLPMVRAYLAEVAPRLFGSTKDRTSRATADLAGRSGGASRNNNFEMIDDDKFGYPKSDIKLGRIGTQNYITGGRGKNVPVEDSDSERHLTKDDYHVKVGRTVDVESF